MQDESFTCEFVIIKRKANSLQRINKTLNSVEIDSLTSVLDSYMVDWERIDDRIFLRANICGDDDQLLTYSDAFLEKMENK